MKKEKIFMDFAQKFQSLSLDERAKFMEKLPRGQVLELYAQECGIEQLRELKKDFEARGLDKDWKDLLQRLKKRHSPYYAVLV